jgi:hypothetical protein
VKAYARKDFLERCLFSLFQKYQGLCPVDLDPDCPFYLQPLQKTTSFQGFVFSLLGITLWLLTSGFNIVLLFQDFTLIIP